MRVGAVDVGYPESGGALAALVLAVEPTFAEIAEERTIRLDHVAPYQPGEFFRRELPALRAVLDGVAMDLLIVDGYVQLDPAGRPGLGAVASGAFGLPVIGVAKTRFRSATHALEVRRGGSDRPLLVTATGFDPAEAATLVAGMVGPYRMPGALRRVDRLSRGAA